MILDNPHKDLALHDAELMGQSEQFSEEDLIQVLAEKVEAYLEANPELLLSYLYRLDVKEKAIHEALSNQIDEPGHVVIARLIWKRQKDRLETKKKYKSQGWVDSWDDF